MIRTTLPPIEMASPNPVPRIRVETLPPESGTTQSTPDSCVRASVDGQAAFADIPGIPFQADEKEIRADGTLRFLNGGCLASVQLGVSWIERIRHDDLARNETAIQTWRPRGVAELAWSFGSLALSIGGGISEHNPTGSIPDPDTMGQHWMAPEVALEASEAGTWLGFGSVRWRVSNSKALWIHGRYERASTPESIGVALPGRPTGQRNGWVVGGGVVLWKGGES